jgi:hypothetical protein
MTTMSKPRRKLPPVKSRPLRRKGNHPSNPYAGEAATAPQLEDRPGYPFAAPRFKADLSDEAQLGRQPPPPGQAQAASAADAEPTFTLRARDPMFGMIVRFWANAHEKIFDQDVLDAARKLAARGDAWWEKNSAGG